MEVIKNLNRGENGTKRYLRKYGERLLCVRYRIDKESGKRYTTVELIVDQAFYRPKTEYEKERFPRVNRYLYVCIAYEEKDLQVNIRRAGGKWIKDKKRWKISYYKANNLGLNVRIEEVQSE